MVNLPFPDRLEAGRALADELEKRGAPADAIVCGLSRGGVPVAFSVADRLHRALDVIVVRKLGVPWQPELAMGAVTLSTQVLEDETIAELGIREEEIERVVARERAEIRRREELYRSGRPALDLSGRTVILVDDGLATGSTMVAAARQTRSRKPTGLIIGVPVGSKEACERLRGEADAVICLVTPKGFHAVGRWYRDFGQVSDTEVQNLLAESRDRLTKYPAGTTGA